MRRQRNILSKPHRRFLPTSQGYETLPSDSCSFNRSPLISSWTREAAGWGKYQQPRKKSIRLWPESTTEGEKKRKEATAKRHRHNNLRKSCAVQMNFFKRSDSIKLYPGKAAKHSAVKLLRRGKPTDKDVEMRVICLKAQKIPPAPLRDRRVGKGRAERKTAQLAEYSLVVYASEGATSAGASGGVASDGCDTGAVNSGRTAFRCLTRSFRPTNSINALTPASPTRRRASRTIRV